MIQLRKANDRGRGNFGWLDSRHTFSFGSYYDPEHMGYSTLRVINDDIVKPGAGFDTHGHRDMEIISYVVEGSIAHKDSEGHVQTLPAGEFQLMSAGSGITHSEYNASNSDTLRFLQIWIQPNVQGQQPGYQQKDFGQAPGLTSIATSTGENSTLHIKQDASLEQLILTPNSQLEYSVEGKRKVYVHLVEGQLQIDDALLLPGDGAKIAQLDKIQFSNDTATSAMALIFNL
jgi:hypothetical protein